MKAHSQVMDLFVDLQKEPYDWKKDVIINKPKFLEEIEEALKIGEIFSLRNKIYSISSVINYPRSDKIGLLNIDKNGDTAILKRGLCLRN